MINNHKTQGEWEIKLTMGINFFSSKDPEETRIMYEIIELLFKSLLQRYKKGLEESMQGSEFVFDSVNSLYYKLHEISLNKGGSYIDSPKWLKNKKATIKPKNNNEKYFQYAITVALNHEQIKKDPQRITKIKLFIDQYNWKDIDFSSNKKDWKKFELNNKSIALNILYVTHNTEKTRQAYESKYNLERENQLILLMITDDEKWHYLAVKNCLHYLGE